MRKKYKVSKDIEGKRLDVSLFILMKNVSRTFIKNHINDNQVWVNGEVEYKANYKVNEGDILEIEYTEDDGHFEILPENISLDILYEDDDLVIINKPSGMVVHPASGNWTGTVMNAIAYKYQNMKGVGNNIRSGLIHRLDKDTSGILMIGKTNRALWYYSKLFANRKINKDYIACLSGRVVNKSDDFDIINYMARSKKNRKKMEVITDEKELLSRNARIAKSRFRIIEKVDNKYLYLVSLLTGRTHQIRVHSAYLGAPVVGDTMYGGIEHTRLMLHAYQIKFIDLKGVERVIKASLSKDFIDSLEGFGFNDYLSKFN